ncbi:hypothetical protein [Sunxiuqinia sp. sy24]|uniref:hypothetical protein n=1 Tax=Sunxiuqinia sp. sy24 TaxID=3461495 RepID=UPI00404601B5
MKMPTRIAFPLILAGLVCLIHCSTPDKRGKDKNIENTSEVAPTREGHFTVVGKMKTVGDTLSHSEMTIYDGTEPSGNTSVIDNNQFRIDFQLNKAYTVVFSKPGFSAKKISINTHIPDSVSSVFPDFEVVVSLDQGSNKDTVDQPKPVGKIYYNATIDNFEAVVSGD